MKRIFIWLLAIMPALVLAQEAPKTVQEAATGSLMFTEGRVVQLAEAFPEDKYDWRPGEGVRSVGESLMHLAIANYFIVMTAGHTPPEGIDLETFEKSVTGKENIIAAVKASYSYAREGVQAIAKKQLGDKVEFPFPGNFNKLSSLFVITGHCEEHMGQLIAYARMNGITPPWSEPKE
jgi:uncharacterized damage-inducible protein DinB